MSQRMTYRELFQQNTRRQRLLQLRIAGYDYAVSGADVIGVQTAQTVRLAGAHFPGHLGFAPLHRATGADEIPVVDISYLLGQGMLPRTDENFVVTVRHPDAPLGLLCGGLPRHLAYPADDLWSLPPALLNRQRPCFRGAFRSVDGALIVLLHVEQLLTAAERAALVRRDEEGA